jgi:hypothetical protein
VEPTLLRKEGPARPLERCTALQGAAAELPTRACQWQACWLRARAHSLVCTKSKGKNTQRGCIMLTSADEGMRAVHCTTASKPLAGFQPANGQSTTVPNNTLCKEGSDNCETTTYTTP